MYQAPTSTSIWTTEHGEKIHQTSVGANCDLTQQRSGSFNHQVSQNDYERNVVNLHTMSLVSISQSTVAEKVGMILRQRNVISCSKAKSIIYPG